MGVTTNLELLQITETQAQKAAAANIAIQGVEEAVSSWYNLVTTSATVLGTDVVLPFDDATDISSRLALRHIRLQLLAGATANFNVIHPANRHMFICKNLTNVIATVKTAGGTGVDLAPNAEAVLYCDGTNVVKLVQAEDRLELSKEGAPVADEVLFRGIARRNAKLPANLVGSVGAIGVLPTASTVLTVRDDATAVGTITISTGGVFTFATTSGAVVSIAAGSVITITNQAVADATAANIVASLPIYYA